MIFLKEFFCFSISKRNEKHSISRHVIHISYEEFNYSMKELYDVFHVKTLSGGGFGGGDGKTAWHGIKDYVIRRERYLLIVSLFLFLDFICYVTLTIKILLWVSRWVSDGGFIIISKGKSKRNRSFRTIKKRSRLILLIHLYMKLWMMWMMIVWMMWMIVMMMTR